MILLTERQEKCLPIISIKDRDSPAYGKLAAWFNTNKKRLGTKKNRDAALNRLNYYRILHGERPLKRAEIHSFHHLSKDRASGSPENLFGCTSAEQHHNIELQGVELFTTLFNMGKIGFDYVTKKYFIACDELEKQIKDWLSIGAPKNWIILGHKKELCKTEELISI